jgi:DNA (cytosine-5)-methyltransferase 1
MRSKRTKGQDISVTDLFCGAGGSSIGAELAGARLVMAANHWRLAIDTHNSNFPNAAHDCADISQVDPRRYPRTDILIASPECTTHSPAGGKRPSRTLFDDSPPGIEEIERSRVTMWDVVRFTEHHRYDAIVVENVIEIRRWLPFDSWIMAMRALGYEHKPVYMNSLVAHPTPQSRDRIYVVFWREGNRAPDLRFDVPAWCPKCTAVVQAVQSWKRPEQPHGKYRTQYLYRCPSCTGVALPFAYPAATAIDWSLPAPRIGDRERPLADATMRRIKAGLEKYGPAAVVAAAGNTWERRPGVRSWPLTDPLPTQATTAQHALVVDTVGYDGQKVRPVIDPFPTQTARQTQALVVPMTTNGVAFDAHAQPLRTTVAECSTQAIVVPLRTHGTALHAASEPLRAQVAGNQGQALVIPMRQHTRPTTTSSPLPTMNASQIGAGLLVPAGGTWNDEAIPTSDPMRTRTGRENEALVIPPMLVRQYEGGSEMTTPVTEPARTITAIDHHALLVPYYGTGVAHPTSEPVGAVTAIDRRALLTPMAVDVEDCGFRMLEPHEIGAAMAFPPAYKVLGNKRERVRQYGNAVTPPVMDLILRRVIASLGGGR